MADEEKQDDNKGMSGGFVWLLLVLFLLALFMQNFIDTKLSRVSFSYQLEHLVNLQLIQPDESRKIALNDNLVTFSGRFRDRLTEEGKNRYHYLELLHKQNGLKEEEARLNDALDLGKTKVSETAVLFLQLSGFKIPPEGYVVVSEANNSQERDFSVVVHALPHSNIQSLPVLREELLQVEKTPSPVALKNLGNGLGEWLRNFRSPAIGIGSETTKQTLKKIEKDLFDANTQHIASTERLQMYRKILDAFQAIVDEVGVSETGFRLVKLRSVRAYKELLDEQSNVRQQLLDNQLQLDQARQAIASTVWYFNNQQLSSRSLEKQDPEVFAQWFAKAKEEWNNFSHNRGAVFRAPDQPLNAVLTNTFKSEEPTPNYFSYLLSMLPVLLVMLALYFVFARQMKGMGSAAMNFGKSPARLLTKGQNKITFKDVAGVDEALEELQEIVEFLKHPQKFTSLGGKIPKGVLCIGPPGTGKTLIAKAVAGEADRPFFSISGSDFVEMFVGVGASRIRDLFDQAKKAAPCIIFMDEIDAVGRHRGVGIGGGHDEREQTLNQLLVEMDGFDTNEGVILMAATNRPDVLDKALLRPGRFDRRVIIGLPDIKGRYEILKVHAKKIKMDPNVDLMTIARSTPGSSGADLANILNEAALLAARKGRTAVTTEETLEARDKVLYGKERRSLELDQQEKRTTAYHESGHAIVGLMVKASDPVHKVTIIPRGLSLGSTMFLPKKNRVNYWRSELRDQLAVAMGGRIAEEVFLHDLSSGAQNDLERATELARNMVCKWGMSDQLGPVTYERPEGGAGGYPMFDGKGKDYSEETARLIDQEVMRILQDATDYAREIIVAHRHEVEEMTEALLRFETLDPQDLKLILDGQWDPEGKEQRLKEARDLYKPSDLPPPPPPVDEEHPVDAATP